MSKSYVLLILVAVAMAALVGCPPSTPTGPTTVQVSTAAFGMANGSYTIRAFVNASNISSATFQLWQVNDSHQYFPVSDTVEVQANAQQVTVVETNATYNGYALYYYANWWYYYQGGYYNPIPWAWYLLNKPQTTDRTETVNFNLYQGDGAVLYTAFTGLPKPAAGDYKVVVTGWDTDGNQIQGEAVVTDISQAEPENPPEDNSWVDPAAVFTALFTSNASEHSIYLDMHHWDLRNTIIGWPDSQKPASLGLSIQVNVGDVQWLITLPWDGTPRVFNLADIIRQAGPGVITLRIRFVAFHPTTPNPAELAGGYHHDGRYWLNAGKLIGCINGTVIGIGTTGGTPLTEATANGQKLGYFVFPIIGGTTTQKYTLTTTAQPTGAGTVTGAGTYDAGANVLVGATANSGWQFSYWTVNGNVGTDHTGQATVTMDSDVNLVAVFTQTAVEERTLTTSVVGNGTVSGGGTYAAGAQVTVTATPASGWQFSGWSGDAAGNANPTVITLNTNKSVTATFTQIVGQQYTLTGNTVGSGTIAGTGTYAAGASVTVTATPASGWQFSGWSGDLTGTTNPTNVIMTANKTITASFVQINTGNEPVIKLTDGDNSVSLSIYPGNYSLGEMIASASAIPGGRTFADVVEIGVEFIDLPSPWWFCRESSSATWTAGSWSSTISLDGVGTNNDHTAVSFPILTATGRMVPFVVLSGSNDRHYFNSGIMPAKRNGVQLELNSNGGYNWNK